MVKSEALKPKITFLLLLALTAFIVLGYFNGISSLNFLSLLILLFSIVYFSSLILSNLNQENKSSYDELPLWLLFIAMVKALFLTVAGTFLDSYPIDIVLLITLAYYQPLLHAALYASFISVIDILPVLLHSPTALTQHPLQYIFIVGMMFITTVAVNALTARERRNNKRLEGMLQGVEANTRELANYNKSADTTLNALSGGDKEEITLSSAHMITDSIPNTLGVLKKILGCNNCILFDVGEKKLTVVAAASPDKDMCYELPNKSAENLLSWVAEHRVPLRIGQIRDIKGARYYTRDVGIASLIAVPMFSEKEALKNILCADSKEIDAFTADTERLLILASHWISESLKNLSIINQITTEKSEFSAFYRLSKRISSSLKLEEILDIAINSCKEIVDYDIAAFIFKENQESLKVVSAQGFKAAELINKSFQAKDSIAGWVIKYGKSLLFPDIQTHKKNIIIFPGTSLPIRSLICLPLPIQDDVLGAFVMASNKNNFFSPYETKIFEVIATHAATAISNAKIYQQMEQMATTDGLTGLLNHKCFQERLAAELERAERYKERVSLLLVDIDHFKQVNDTYGHPAGDKILKDVSNILASSIRRGIDVAARYGGEEFALILVNTDGKGAFDTAERMRRVIEQSKFDIGSTCIKITSSIGIAVFPYDAGYLDQGGNQRLLISKADSTLYLAKKEGRNKTYLYKDVADRIALRKLVSR